MNIFVKGYLANNLGDDLFFDVLTNRYKNINFIMSAPKEYRKMNYKNLKVYNERSLLNLCIKGITLKKKSIEDFLVKKSDFSILIGGSIFIQKEKNNFKKYSITKKDYYVLGANFGPFQTTEYYKEAYKFFSLAKDVCFRDKYSYNLFNKLENIRYAPDIVFSMDTSKIKKIDSKKVVISVIDCEKKVGNNLTEKYNQKILEIIEFFTEKEYEIVLMSFCKKEGDENAINNIINEIKDINVRKSIKTYYYNGNIKEALEVIGDSKIVVGSRFHSNILGLILEKTIIPICYSDKMTNVLKDINFRGKIIDLKRISEFKVNSLTEQDLNYKLDISRLKKEAHFHFEKLDKVLKKNSIQN